MPAEIVAARRAGVAERVDRWRMTASSSAACRSARDAALGHRLLTEALAARPSYLWVLDGNDRAAGFYRRQGFVPDGAVRVEPEGRELRMVRR
ncbi:hypothetical protein ACFJIY_17135 [Pimelobacter simplex]|uniref:hypothetical protein n=1 Tax=Nocardioides simplex TaxID=2045 RepID=UPI00366D8D2A